MKKWHKYGLAISIILAITSWAIALIYWNKLPNVIPTHFGYNGKADDWNTKSVLWVYLLPFVQTVVVSLLGFLYYKPQYSDMPTTLWLMTMEAKDREHAFDQIRTMLVGTSIWISVLLSYMVFEMNASALRVESGINPLILFSLIGGMFVWLIWWTVKVYKTTREIIKKKGSK